MKAYPHTKHFSDQHDNDFMNGMDLRDYFAARCPHSYSVNWGQIIKFKNLPRDTPIEEWKDEYTLEWECHKRYEWADAMMKARSAK